MDRPSVQSFALAPNHARGNQSSPRPRKKLQKTVGLPSSYPLARRPASASVSRAADGGKKTKARTKPATARQTSSSTTARQAQTPARAIPDLSDAKWLGYVRSHHSKESLKLPASMARDFSYLSITKPPHHQTPRSSRFTITTMRRRAKTPVFSIGQLEGLPPHGRFRSPARTPSHEGLDLELHRRRADDCGTRSFYSETHSEPSPSLVSYREEEYEPRRQRSSDDLPSTRPFPSSPDRTSPPIGASPTSDDGTLVSFEEERVYFKPVSFSPSPPPSPTYGSSFESNASSNPFASPNNLSLQICLDLLTRELSSAVSDRRRRPSDEISALQIWVMIEAFERLRDQVAEMRLGVVGGVGGVESMFETWLKALYAIHDSLAAESMWRETGEGEYEGLQEALD